MRLGALACVLAVSALPSMARAGEDVVDLLVFTRTAGFRHDSIPAGLAQPEGDGPELPVGFQIAAPAFAEQKLLEAAFALEGAIGFAATPGIPYLNGGGEPG